MLDYVLEIVMLALIIDDDPSIRFLWQMIFRSLDVQVKLAANGLEGLELIKQCTPDMIISDYHMGQATGYEVWRTLRANEKTREIPFIMASSSILSAGLVYKYQPIMDEIKRDPCSLVLAKEDVTRPRMKGIMQAISENRPVRLTNTSYALA